VTDAIFPQCRIVAFRLLNPDTLERLLNKVFAVGGIRRVVLNGPNLPATIPFGPAHGLTNPHTMKRSIQVCNQDFELQVHAGTIILELEDHDAIPRIKEACDEVFATLPFGYRLQEGRYMKTEATLSDYAKYGPNADRDIIGLTEPKSKIGPIIIQGVK
jgi:methyl-coenzyme M reductase subunit D